MTESRPEHPHCSLAAVGFRTDLADALNEIGMPASFTIDFARRIVFSRAWGILVDDDLRQTQKGVRLDLARAQLAEARRSAAVGATASEATASAENQVNEKELLVARERYNIAEIKKTAKAPRDELNAPLVNGRDYMKDRLNLRLVSAQRQMQLAEAAQVEVARRDWTSSSSRATPSSARRPTNWPVHAWPSSRSGNPPAWTVSSR